MIKKNSFKNLKIFEIEEKYPFSKSFFKQNQIPIENHREKTITEILKNLDEFEMEKIGMTEEEIIDNLIYYIDEMLKFIGVDNTNEVESLTIISGTDKSGKKEKFDSINIKKSEIISIVGPTGSGKSRLLADIEWTANKDTPTKRQILINNKIPDPKWRFSTSNKLVAELSQNMNFIMDLSVKEFLKLHAQSRLINNPIKIIKEIIESANYLSGESFNDKTPITSLSGGQSRALMIADTAILSKSPIVLIDEIENAGIDRKKAINLLINKEKIVLIATHDPLLALMANKRIVIKNGGIEKVMITNNKEIQNLKKLETLEKEIQNIRTELRNGKIIENINI
ncbi:ABC-type lipoprotein export system ATPase subunit [Oceanotoga teriensis]|jgi:ABC-type lipoprotein export system ATPase subunit|uniref:ABC-type lipoprotein export system ATPase subunit n=1 Tax=Oceanotoga teriensis TaxID=515440 RepID=A0AA45HJR7_9BACT|nr:ATP-binding cassette domain-containing protein [Oceanotoga teriensis]PWJ96628.1 ABC-type lipoprotein export system ATPase subunit [Oceanotoga teriensis]